MKLELAILDNVLNQECFNIVIDEINAHRNDMELDSDYATYRRWYPPFGAIVSNIFDSAIYDDRIFNIVKKYHDLSWKWYCAGVANKFEVQATSYKKERNDRYDWHVDHIGPEERVLNCILYLNDVNKGGSLQIANEFDLVGEVDFDKDYPILETIQPKKNRLVIIPSWYIHRVTPLESNDERLTLNGHIVMSEEGIQSVCVKIR